jgi:hypothetical protein
MGPDDYGRYYWCIKTQLGEIFLHADRVEVTATGALICWGGGRQDEQPPDNPTIMLALQATQWDAVYAASCMDGTAVAVDHWLDRVDTTKTKRAKS